MFLRESINFKMTVNFKAQTGLLQPYSKSDNKPDIQMQNLQRIDSSNSHSKTDTYNPTTKTSKDSSHKELGKNILIGVATVPIVLSGGYLGAIRTAERKFFVDSAKNSKKYFKPIIDELKNKITKVDIKTVDKLNLKCWDINPQNSQKYVLVCHGNGQNLNDCQELYNSLHKKGYGVFALEYRGYADNPGSVYENGFYKDADAALEYLKKKGIKEEKIGVVGYSLGGAVATELSSRKNLAFTILTSTFNNAKELSKNGVNYLDLKLSDRTKKFIDNFPESLIPIKNSYRSDRKISKIKNPIVFIHSQDDKGIPISLAKKLSGKATNASFLEFITLNSGDHWLDKDKIKAISDALDKFHL